MKSHTNYTYFVPHLFNSTAEYTAVGLQQKLPGHMQSQWSKWVKANEKRWKDPTLHSVLLGDAVHAIDAARMKLVTQVFVFWFASYKYSTLLPILQVKANQHLDCHQQHDEK